MSTVATLWVLCGLPGSGKTTAGRLLEKHRGVVRLSPDEWLHDLGLEDGGWAARGAVERLQKRVARGLLEAGLDVAVEDGFWLRSQRDAMRALATEAGAVSVVVFLHAPIDELWRRIDGRNREPRTFHVSRTDLENWGRGLEEPAIDEPVIHGLDQLAQLTGADRADNLSPRDVPAARSAG